MAVDLYLGASIGRWVLGELGPRQSEIRTVISLEPEIRALASASGYSCSPTVPTTSEIDGGIGFSVHFPKIFRADLISSYDQMYNLHPGFLPWGRGYYPVFWALWAGEPAGATLHEIVAALDRGDIIDQTRVMPTEYSTGGSLHAEVVAAEKQLFSRHWRALASGHLPRAQPAQGAGAYHCLADFLALRDSPPLANMSALKLVQLMRALTFEGRRGPLLDCGGGAVFSADLRPAWEDGARS
jgi:hypothetical protein